MSRHESPAEVSAQIAARVQAPPPRRRRRDLPAPQVLVRAPGVEVSAGDRDLPFHAASVGKIATATLVLQEVERGLDLATPVASLLPGPEIEGLFAGPGATVEHLLAHTSGTPDFFDGPVESGPVFAEEILADPQRLWTPADTLDFVRSRQRPVLDPGTRFSYSDTGYVLLGRILEEHTGEDLAHLLRSRVFEPAGMSNSVLWLHDAAAQPAPGRIAPLWLDDVEVSSFRSLSFDWAAGGLVTTLDDLAALAGALTAGTLLTPETFELMRTPRHRLRRGVHYGLGMMELRFGEFMPLLRGLPRPVGGVGVSAAMVFFDPARHTTVVLNFHSTREMGAAFTTHLAIARALARLG